ncbi:family 43 glycosylhydrolase [Brachybacterium sp. DNPG3]
MPLASTAPTAPAPAEHSPEVSSAEHPVIPGFHPDPSICRAGEEFFLAASSFEYHPGVPLFRSTDLTHWELAGHALTDDPAFPAGRAGANGGVYAPTLRHHDGLFWMITTDVSGGGGQLVTSAPSIEGPWGPARVIPGIIGIDPDLFWDEDDTCYVTYSSNDPAAPDIAQVRVDLEAGTIIGEPATICHGTGMAYPEGPHILRRGDWFYLLYSEGGTERGHCVSIARAPRPDGPFTLLEQNPILTRRSTVFPVQNTGHADMVELADGSWAMVYLAVRARGGTPMFHVNGRETFVAGIEWSDDAWPTVVPDAFSFVPTPTAFALDATGPTLPLRFTSPGAALADFTRIVPGEGVEISPAETANRAPSMLALRATDLAWRYEADLAAASEGAAVRLRMDESHYAELRVEDGRALLHVQIGPASLRTLDEVPLGAAPTFRIEAVEATHGGPDDLIFTVIDTPGTGTSTSTDHTAGAFDDPASDPGRTARELGRIDGRYLSTEVAGGFLGRTIGVRAVNEPVMVTAIRYTPIAGQNTNADGLIDSSL